MSQFGVIRCTILFLRSLLFRILIQDFFLRVVDGGAGGVNEKDKGDKISNMGDEEVLAAGNDEVLVAGTTRRRTVAPRRRRRRQRGSRLHAAGVLIHRSASSPVFKCIIVAV